MGRGRPNSVREEDERRNAPGRDRAAAGRPVGAGDAASAANMSPPASRAQPAGAVRSAEIAGSAPSGRTRRRCRAETPGDRRYVGNPKGVAQSEPAAGTCPAEIARIGADSPGGQT
jgi:hypothetical protein